MLEDTNPQAHRTALLQALLVTFLWSTSWVLIKVGLAEVPALPFAGLRYGLAFLVLLPFGLTHRNRQILARLKPRQWLGLAGYGILLYAFTQGAQFIGLAHLPAVTVSLMLNFTSVLVAVMGFFWLAEQPGRWQWLGTALCIGGVGVYFGPLQILEGQLAALAVVAAGVICNAASAVVGRRINRAGNISPLLVTLVSMGVGSLALLTGGVGLQGLPEISLMGWLITGWLAVVNTAFAFTLWNHTQRTLTAVESSIINSTMLVQIAGLAWLFLGEGLTALKAGGLVLVGAGVLLVQFKSGRPSPAKVAAGATQTEKEVGAAS